MTHFLDRLPVWLRWVLVLPAAVLGDQLAQVLGRIALLIWEDVPEEFMGVLHFAYQFGGRPYAEELIWRVLGTVGFVWLGGRLAPTRQRASATLGLAAIKGAIAVYNLVVALQYALVAGDWSAPLRITDAPLWWGVCMDLTAVAVVVAMAIQARRSAVRDSACSPAAVSSSD